MADTVDSNNGPRTCDSAPSSMNSTTSAQTHAWNDVDDNIQDMEAQYLTVAAETKGHYLVGMSPEEFMEIFMPWNVDTPTAYREKPIPEERLRDLHSMASKKQEKDMYTAFVRFSSSFREIMLYSHCYIGSRFSRLADQREEGSSWRQRYRHQVRPISQTRRGVSRLCCRHRPLYRG